jgi:hypothetical protein
VFVVSDVGQHTSGWWTRWNAVRLLTVFTVTVLVAVAAASGKSTAASPGLVSTVHGIELVAHQTQGTFSGYTTGNLSGGWVAVVNHTPLQPNAGITGGTLTIVTTHAAFKRPITGLFTSGTITNTNPGANCTNQTFAVIGNLTHFNGNHTARLAVTLTHYRHAILGACTAYFATTNGTLTLLR